MLTNRSVLVVYVHWSDRAGRSVHSLLRKPLLCQLCVTLAALTPAVPASAHTTCHLYLLISPLCLLGITAVKTSPQKLVREIWKWLNGLHLHVGCKIFPFILIYCTDLYCWRGWFKNYKKKCSECSGGGWGSLLKKQISTGGASKIFWD